MQYGSVLRNTRMGVTLDLGRPPLTRSWANPQTTCRVFVQEGKRKEWDNINPDELFDTAGYFFPRPVPPIPFYPRRHPRLLFADSTGSLPDIRGTVHADLAYRFRAKRNNWKGFKDLCLKVKPRPESGLDSRMCVMCARHGVDLTQSIFQVILQKSTSTQIRQLIFYDSKCKG